MSQRIALVTGASSGIGAAITRRLAQDGWQVLAAGRDPARTTALAATAFTIRPWVGALATSDDADRLVADCVDAFGGLDLLVNNAGIYEIADAESTTDEGIRDPRRRREGGAARSKRRLAQRSHHDAGGSRSTGGFPRFGGSPADHRRRHPDRRRRAGVTQ